MQLVSADVMVLIRDVAREVAMLASNKGLELRASLLEEAVSVAVDEDSFRRMLLILLDNAIKYTPAGGRVTVSSSEDASSVAIRAFSRKRFPTQHRQ